MICINYNECTLYFAVDCEWQPARVISDCQKNIDAFFNDTDEDWGPPIGGDYGSETESDSDSESEPMQYCYPLISIPGLKEREAKSVIEEVQERMKNKEVYEYPNENEAPKYLQKKIKRICNSKSK